MFVAYTVVAVLLALMLPMSARLKLIQDKRIVDGIHGRLGVPLGLFPFLAACEIAAAVGLVVGIWWAPLGIAAAVGLVLYFVGALGAHLRKADYQGAPTPLIILIASIAVLVLRIAA